MRNFVVAICVTMCAIKTGQLHLKPKMTLCLITGVIIGNSGHPSFLDMTDEHGKYNPYIIIVVQPRTPEPHCGELFTLMLRHRVAYDNNFTDYFAHEIGRQLLAWFWNPGVQIDDESGYEIPQTTFKQEPTMPTTTTEKILSDEWKNRALYRIKCIDEVGIPASKVVKYMSKRTRKVQDIDIQEWLLCILNKMGIMSKEGVFKMDVALSKIPRKDWEAAERMIVFCLPETKMLPYEIAWKYVTCHSRAQGNFSALNVF